MYVNTSKISQYLNSIGQIVMEKSYKTIGSHHSSTHISEKSPFRLRQKVSTGQLSCLTFQQPIE